MSQQTPGALIRSARQARGWTLRDLQAALRERGLQVRIQTISAWERDVAIPRRPTAVADLLGIGLRDLVR